MFKNRKPNRFNYIPRFWDPEKEERERRGSPVSGEQQSLEAMKQRISSKFSNDNSPRYFDAKKHKKSLSQSNRRFYLVLLFLGVIVYYIFFRS